MKYLSLFSGIEACTVAWKSLGWECVAVAEIEPFPCAVLAHHYPDVPNLGDVTKITEQDIKNLGPIDLVVFGSPCQNLSVAGNRKGLQGESSGLFYEAIRIIQYTRTYNGCRFALWENVPGAFSSNKGDDFREVVRELSANRDIETPKNGWGNTGVAVGENGLVEWRVLDAQYFGLAQRRKRVFAIVDFGDWTSRRPILLEPPSLCGNTPPSRETRESVARNAVSCLASGGKVVGTLQANAGDKQWLGNQEAFSDQFHVVHGSQDPISNTETANCLGRNNGLENVIFFAEPRCSRGVEVINSNQPCSTLQAFAGTGGGNTPMVAIDVVAIAGNIIGRTEGNGGNHTGVDDSGTCYTLTTADRHAVAFSQKDYGGDVGVEISPTLRAMNSVNSNQNSGGQVAVLKNTTVRRLTPTECEKLQGFPRNYTQIMWRNKFECLSCGEKFIDKYATGIDIFAPAECPACGEEKQIDYDCPDGPRYKALGNSMAVPVMFWIGQRIAEAVA